MKKFSKFKKIIPQTVQIEGKKEEINEVSAKNKRNTYLFVRENHERTIQKIKQYYENKTK